MNTRTVRNEALACQLVVGGLKGGHSGIDIHKHRGNANKILTRLLKQISLDTPLELSALEGGTRKNAISRDAQATFHIDPSHIDGVRQTVSSMKTDIAKEYQDSDPDLFIQLRQLEVAETEIGALGLEDTGRVLNLLLGLPMACMGGRLNFKIWSKPPVILPP